MGASLLCHFEGARRFTLLARGKMSAPQSAAYGRMPMATCCRKRQLFSCRLPSASERRNLWKIAARAVYSLFGNTDCIPPSRGGAKTRSTSQRLCRRSAQGDTIVTFCHPELVEGSLWEYRQNLNRDPSTSLRFAQDDKKVAKLSFNDHIARGKMTLLPKRPQFAENVRHI